MASLFSHPAIPVALRKIGLPVSRRLFFLSVILTILPDADVVAFKFGIPYESQWGHRGFTHSITFSLLVGLFFQFFHDQLKERKAKIFWWCFISTFSHAVLDAFTNGGLGVALLWPLSDARFFFPFRPIAVSPIGISGFISLRGLLVLLSELMCIWLPCFLLSYIVKKVRDRQK